MIKKTLRNILLLLLPISSFAGTPSIHSPSSAITLANPPLPAVDVCNLPAPTNLHVTGTTTNSIALAWNPVAGTNGYWMTVTEFGTGNVPFNSSVPSTNYNVTGLKSGTWYHIEVSSICSGTGQKGGTAVKDAQTDFIIVLDGIVFRDCQEKFGQQSCEDVPISNNHLYLEALDSQNPSQVEQFDVLIESSTNNDLKVYVAYDYVSNEPISADRWVFTNQFNEPPLNGSVKSPLEVKIFHAPPNSQTPNPISDPFYVMKMTFARITGQPDKIHFCWEKIIVPGSTNNTHELNRWMKCSPPQSLIRNSNTISTVQLSPNPFTDALTLYLKDPAPEQSTLHLLDLNGREVLRQPIDPGVNEAAIEGGASLSPGMYLARFESPEGTQTFKVIKSQ